MGSGEPADPLSGSGAQGRQGKGRGLFRLCLEWSQAIYSSAPVKGLCRPCRIMVLQPGPMALSVWGDPSFAASWTAFKLYSISV